MLIYKEGIIDLSDNIKKYANRIGRVIAMMALLNNKNYGIMITGSDQSFIYNGYRIYDYFGNEINRIDQKYFIDNLNATYRISNRLLDVVTPKIIYIGHDTRDSYLKIKNEIINGIKDICETIGIIDYYYVTVPQFQFLLNRNSPNIMSYIDNFNYINNFEKIYIDCANSVSYITLSKIKEVLNFRNLNFINKNINMNEFLHFVSGSKYVIKYNKPPLEYINKDILSCSINSDGTEVVFYYHDEKFCLMNGHYISAIMLYASYLKLKDTKFKILYCYDEININLINYLKKLNIDIKDTNISSINGYDLVVSFDKYGFGNFRIINKKLLNIHFFNYINRFNNELTSDAICNIFIVLYCLKTANYSYREWFNIL